MHSRFYENALPDVDTVVMCEIQKVDLATGAHVILLEYDNKEGLIMTSECTNKNARLITRLLKVGK